MLSAEKVDHGDAGCSLGASENPVVDGILTYENLEAHPSCSVEEALAHSRAGEAAGYSDPHLVARPMGRALKTIAYSDNHLEPSDDLVAGGTEDLEWGPLITAAYVEDNEPPDSLVCDQVLEARP